MREWQPSQEIRMRRTSGWNGDGRNSGCDMFGWNGGGGILDAICPGGMAAGGIPDAMCPDGMAVEEFRMRYVRVE